MIGELDADQATRFSKAILNGPFDAQLLVQARAADGGWRLLELDQARASARHICQSMARWPAQISHDSRFDASDWPGRRVEIDDARMLVGNVTPIRGGTVAAADVNYAVPEIVDMFERFHEQAKRGEISAAAIAITRPNGAFGVDWATGNARPAALLAAASMLLFRIQRKIAAAMDGQEDGGPDAAS